MGRGAGGGGGPWATGKNRSHQTVSPLPTCTNTTTTITKVQIHVRVVDAKHRRKHGFKHTTVVKQNTGVFFKSKPFSVQAVGCMSHEWAKHANKQFSVLIRSTRYRKNMPLCGEKLPIPPPPPPSYPRNRISVPVTKQSRHQQLQAFFKNSSQVRSHKRHLGAQQAKV